MDVDRPLEVTCRVVGVDEWELVRRTRLDALTAEPLCFGMALYHDEALSEADWRASLTENRWVLGQTEGQVVGLVALFPTDTSPDGLPQLGSMWVSPRVRLRGLAARLELEIARLATTLGFGGLGLWVPAGNDGAARAYEALGYTRSGAQKPAPRDQSVPMHRMVRAFDPPQTGKDPAAGTRYPPEAK